MARGVCVSLEYDTTSRGKKSTWVIFDTPSLCSLRLRWNTQHQKVSHGKRKSAAGTNVCCYDQDKNTSVFVKVKHNTVCMRSASLQWRKITWVPFVIINEPLDHAAERECKGKREMACLGPSQHATKFSFIPSLLCCSACSRELILSLGYTAVERVQWV